MESCPTVLPPWNVVKSQNNATFATVTEAEQINALSADIANVIDRYRQEFDLGYAAMIGVLHFRAHCLVNEAIEVSQEQENDENNAG